LNCEEIKEWVAPIIEYSRKEIMILVGFVICYLAGIIGSLKFIVMQIIP
jgi:hypothetical protein